MVTPGTRLWHRHPGVRSGAQLTVGERAADILKRWFGTWTALGAVGVIIAVWILLQRTSIKWDIFPYILLNLCLSCLAAVQGIILQISANRGDRISGEVALHTQGNTETMKQQSEEILALTQQQMIILASIEQIRQAVAPEVPAPKPARTRTASGRFAPESREASERLHNPATDGQGEPE